MTYHRITLPEFRTGNTDTPSDDALLTTKEAMSYLRISRSTLCRLIYTGQLASYKVRGTWRFYRNDLKACIHKQECRKA